MRNDQDHFNILREIQKRPKSSQRELAEELGFSLGKLNYCLKALQKKGFVKLRNFTKNPNKINYFYMIVIFAFLVLWISQMIKHRKDGEEHTSA